MKLWPVTMVIGGALVALALTLAIWEHVWISRAEIAEGKVVDMANSRTRMKGKSGRAPVVRYRRADGSEHTFTRSYFTQQPLYQSGQRVVVAYDKGTGEARIVRFHERYGVAAVLGSLGTGLLCLGGCFFYGGKGAIRFYTRQKGLASGTNPMPEVRT